MVEEVVLLLEKIRSFGLPTQTCAFVFRMNQGSPKFFDLIGSLQELLLKGLVGGVERGGGLLFVLELFG